MTNKVECPICNTQIDFLEIDFQEPWLGEVECDCGISFKVRVTLEEIILRKCNECGKQFKKGDGYFYIGRCDVEKQWICYLCSYNNGDISHYQYEDLTGKKVP